MSFGLPHGVPGRTLPGGVLISVAVLLAAVAHSGLVAAPPFVAAADDSGNVYVIESNGDGTWSNWRLESYVGDGSRGVAVADFTGDGYADILVGSGTGSTMVFSLLTNEGTNHFFNRGSIGSSPSAGAAFGLSAGDFNHDGHMDVVASGDSTWIVVGLGRGDGTFAFTSTNTGIGSGRGVDVGDVDQDGHLDFVRGRYSNGEISYFRGDGTGAFTRVSVVADPGTDPYGVALADFNNDGFLDLVAEAGSSGDAFFYAGNGTGSFAAGLAVTGPDVNNHAGFADLDADGDGNRDLVMADYSGKSLYYARGNGDGTFQAAVKISTSNTSSNVLGIGALPGSAPTGYPLAVISPSPYSGVAGATVDFDASGSTVGGGATTWTADWQFGDGGAATGVTRVSHTYPAVEGDYVVRLTLTDDLGRVAVTTGLVRLLGDRPVAVAGGPYTFGESFANAGVWTVPLYGSGSSDSSGNPLTYAWDPGNGLNETFGTPFQGNLPAPGLWAYSDQVTLAGGEATIVGDGVWGHRYLVSNIPYARWPGQSFRGRLRVTAGGTRTVAWGLKNAGNDFNYTQFIYAIYVNNGSVSIFENGSNRGNVGTCTDGVTYELRLDVKTFGVDYYMREAGAPAWTSLYTSLYSNASPFRFGATARAGTHTLEGLDSSVALLTVPEPTVVYPRGGDYTASLTVTDSVGQTDTEAVLVSLVPGAPPVADPGGPYAPGEAAANRDQWTLTLDGTGSTDDNGIYLYLWDFGDGSSATGPTPSHTYAAGGTYGVSLTVWDHALQSHTATTTVTTTPAAPPVPDPAGPYVVDERYAHNGLWTYTFDGSASTDDFGISTYAWDFGEVSAMAFDGGGPDAVVVPDAPELRPAQLTVAAWVYPDSFPNWATVLMKCSNSSWADGYGLTHTNGIRDLRFFVNGYTNTYVETTLDRGTWSFVAATFDGARICLYVNGDPVGECLAAPINHATGNLEIGNGSGGDYPWNGQIDDVSLWDRALTPLEVRQLATQPPTPPVANLVAFWDFADGSGADRSGNGHAGTLAGNAAPARATGTGVAPSYAFVHPGTHEVTLTVTDHANQARTATTRVTLQGNEPPVADAGPSLVTEAGMPVTLDASGSTDDFGIWRTCWDVGVPLAWDTAGGAVENGEVVLVGAGSWGSRYFVANSATPRVAGDSYSARIGVAPNAGSNRYVRWGLKDASLNYGDAAFTYAIYFANGTLRVYENGSNRGDKGTYDEGRFYEVRIDLKSSGATYYVRPEGANAWTQIYDSNFSNTSPLRLGLIVNSGVAVASDFAGPAGPLPLPPALRLTETQLEVVYGMPGTYHPSVRVTDHAWQSDTASTVVTVVTGLPPVAANGGPYLTNQGVPTRLNGRSSRDDFGIRWYDWDFGDGQSQRSRDPWVDHVYETANTYLLTLTVTDYAGHTSVDTSSVNVSAAPVVACVPWQIQGGVEVPHDTLSGREVLLKGVCWSRATPVTYTWDFGDGSASESGTATDLYRIEARHTYVGIEGTPFTARLTVTDALTQTATDTYPIRIRPSSLDVEINMAIDNGLWWLHGRMTRATFAAGKYADTAIDYGYWTNANGYGTTNYKISPTASALQGFHVNGHRETGDVRQDPYVETAGRGMRYITSAMRPIGIGPQAYGDPDTNANRVGIETSVASDQRAPYEVGPAMDAIVASGEAGTHAVTGTPLLMHRTYRGIVNDMVDTYAWGQTDDASKGGGWQYTWNGSVDNSAAQWGAIGLLAAEEVFHLRIPQWVKDRNDVWLAYSHNGTGFGYTGPGDGNCTTPSGMVQLAFVGAIANDDPATAEDDRDPRWVAAENRIASQWNTTWWFPNSSLNNRFSYYAYYAFTKAMRVARPRPVERLQSTGLDWFRDDTKGIARRLINRQQAAGNWPKDTSGGSSNYVGDDLTTAWSVAMLSSTLFVQAPVADAGETRVWGLDVTLQLDGSRSYHLDPSRTITRYEWDLDEDGVYDTSSTDPTVRVTYTPAGLLINGSPGGSAGTTYPPESLPRNLVIALRVTDDNNPAITDVDTVTITLAIPPRPPIAAAGGPYQARVGVPLVLYGGASFDIDPTDFITEWQWDTDGDQVYDDASGETVSVTFDSVGVFNLGLRVSDNAVMNDLNHNGVQDPEERLVGFDFTTVTVVANSAPILDRSARFVLTPITEDTADPAGDTVEALLASDPALPTPVTDIDDDPVGIAVTGLSSTGPGTWQFRLEGAATWTDFGALSVAAATLLPAGARVRFVPSLPYHNGQVGVLTFQAWDQTHGSAGDTGVDASLAGGDTAFSLASDSADLMVTDVNDAPLLAAAADLRLTGVAEDDGDPPGDTVAALLASAPAGSPDLIVDPDAGALEGIAVVGLSGGSLGTWQFRRAVDSTWQTFGSVSDYAATLLAPDARVRFLPGADFFGTTAALTFRAWDQTSGSAGDTDADTSVNGGTSAFSAATAAAVLTAPERPDLRVEEVDSSLVITPCGSLESGGTAVALVRNDGGSTTRSPATVRFFEDRDLDGQYDASVDALLGSGTLAAGLAPAASAAVSAVVSGTVLFAGNRVFAEVDPDDAVTETREDNNLGCSGTACTAPVEGSPGGGPKAVLGVPAADLTASYLRLALVHLPLDIQLIARVGNGGATLAPAGLAVAFYDGDPEAGGSLIGVAQTSLELPPGSYEDVAIAVAGSFVGPHTVFVRADDDGSGGTTVAECNEANNTCALEVTIVPNRAPVLDPGAVLAFTPIDEDTVEPAGDSVQAVLDSDPVGVPVPITDGDGDPPGIEVVDLTQADRGVWQYALASGPWLDVGPVSPASALLLDAGSRLRFVPDLAYNNGHTAWLTFRAWDQTAGTAGQSGVDASASGGYTPFSIDTASVLLLVQDVNDAPRLERIAGLSAPEVSAGDTDPPGFSVQTVLAGGASSDGISDPDNGAAKGIAVTGLQGLSGGGWQFLLAGEDLWHEAPDVSPAAALLLPFAARLRFVPPTILAGDQTLTVSFCAWDLTSGTPGSTAGTTPNGGTTAFSVTGDSFSLRVHGGAVVVDNWWYPAFSWEPIPMSGSAKSYGWYHVQVFAATELSEPYFEANVHGTTMTATDYFLAAFDGFPGGRWLWRYRPWDPATDSYGPFTPASLDDAPDPAYVLDLDYGLAAVPTGLTCTHPAAGIHLLQFLVANARGYEVKAVRDSDGSCHTWRHAFIPGEDPDKQQGTPATFDLDNPPMDPPLIPRDQPATLAVNLPESGVYRLYVRGFNPTDERDGMPPFTEFSEPLTVATPQPAHTPPIATGLLPRDGDVIARTESVSRARCRLLWDPMVGADRFLLYLAAVDEVAPLESPASPDLNLPSGSYFDFVNVGAATLFDVDLLPGLYTWQVVGISDQGAVPDYGTWSPPRYFDVIPQPLVPAVPTSIEVLSSTRIRVTWSPIEAMPDLVEVWLLDGPRSGQLHYAPRALLDVNGTEGTGEIEFPDLPGSRQRRLRVCGYALSGTGALVAGETVTFLLPSPRRSARPSIGSE